LSVIDYPHFDFAFNIPTTERDEESPPIPWRELNSVLPSITTSQHPKLF
jgi:hypothetical protein